MMISPKLKYFIFFFIYSIGIMHSIAAMEPPWDWNNATVSQNKSGGSDLPSTSTLQLFSNHGIKFFQRYVSPADGPRCNFYPSCSEYCKLAIQKHGFIIGIILFNERFMRDHGFDLKHYPVIWIGGQVIYYDSVEMNDFWWKCSNKSSSSNKPTCSNSK
ncbi:MAG: hypothetical protein A2161_18140 [Candidatus Schekmanbacteria bacterium RBG_13_48_7]|uniref:Membrane protein insertion efficiency factor YidD n=1 Tax=Candidatus Schekmanbacteria bacterium RBG_13_48_7 TaxID=1817878 RepID=A0A1F7RRD9_9BACT|nr:MAG: hypothetical protein A2161_18140 [Candidatus Schekmanbacteria bacterium RBG_13_48_7]